MSRPELSINQFSKRFGRTQAVGDALRNLSFDGRTTSLPGTIRRHVPVYGLQALTLVLIGLLSVLLFNLRPFIADKAIIALLALAAAIPAMTGKLGLPEAHRLFRTRVLGHSRQPQGQR